MVKEAHLDILYIVLEVLEKEVYNENYQKEDHFQDKEENHFEKDGSIEVKIEVVAKNNVVKVALKRSTAEVVNLIENIKEVAVQNRVLEV